MVDLWDRLDATLAVCCLLYLPPLDRLASCTVSKTMANLRSRSDLWPILCLRSRQTRFFSSSIVVDEACLDRVASTLPLAGVKSLALADSSKRSSTGVGFSKGWRQLLASFPPQNRVTSVQFKGHVFKTAAFRLVAKKFGPRLVQFECFNDTPALVAELLRQTPILRVLGIDHLSETTCDLLADALPNSSSLTTLKVLEWASYSNQDLACSVSLAYMLCQLPKKFPRLESLDLKKVMISDRLLHLSSEEEARFEYLRDLAFSFRYWVKRRPDESSSSSHLDSLPDSVVLSVASRLARACPVLKNLVVEFECTADSSVVSPFLDSLSPSSQSVTFRGLRIRNIQDDARTIVDTLTAHWPPNLTSCKIVFGDVTYLGLCIQDDENLCSWAFYFRSVFATVTKLLHDLDHKPHASKRRRTTPTKKLRRLSTTQRLQIGVQLCDRTKMISDQSSVNWLVTIPRLLSCCSNEGDS